MPEIETTGFLLSKIDDFGTPKAYNHYAVGWAHALCTPYQWTKQVASHWGGTRNGTIVHWPNGLADKGKIRSQFHHAIDVAKTILDAAGLPEPTVVNSITRRRWKASACCPPCATPMRPSTTTSSISRYSATAAFTTKAGLR
jgi:arylsulfatase